MSNTAFSEVAADHASRPRNHGPLTAHDGHARVTGPCGDTMEVWLTIADDEVTEVSFDTDGCGSSLACGSMATCLTHGRSVDRAQTLSQQEILRALGGLPEESEHCALLASLTVRAALRDYLLTGGRQDTTSDESAERRTR